MPSKFLTDKQLARHDIETLKRFVRHHLGGYRVMLKDLPPGQPVYRGVEWKDRPTLVGDLGAPPQEKVKLWGRAHRPGRPMFYASVGPPACFYEIKSQPDTHVALSEWVVTKPFWMHNLGYHAQALQRLGVTELGMRAMLAYPLENESKENIRTRLRLSLSFTDEIEDGEQWNYRYKRSVAVFELLFDRAEPLSLLPGGVTIPRAGGTVYPAMRLMGMADNLAIFPEFVIEALALRRVLWIKVEKVDLVRRAYSLLTEAQATDFSGGKIAWEEVAGEMADRRNTFFYEGEHWKVQPGKAGTFFRP